MKELSDKEIAKREKQLAIDRIEADIENKSSELNNMTYNFAQNERRLVLLEKERVIFKDVGELIANNEGKDKQWENLDEFWVYQARLQRVMDENKQINYEDTKRKLLHAQKNIKKQLEITPTNILMQKQELEELKRKQE